MITLDATLKTAQDGINHRPLVEIVSSPASAAIPLRGNYLNPSTDAESDPNIIETSTGRLAMVFVQDDELQYYYTDINKISWNIVVGLCTFPITDASLCELTNGNIGIVVNVDFSEGQYGIKYIIITPTGTIVTSETDIIASQTNWLSAPYVIALADSTYLLVYAEGTGGPPSQANTYYLQKRTSSDFASWSAASEITLSGLSPNKYRNNPHLLQLSGGRIYLHFDYLDQLPNNIEINNLYYCYSDDNGTAWGAPVKITDYDEVGTTGLHITASEKANGTLTYAYNEESNVKIIDEDIDGFEGSAITPCGLDFNPTDRKLYIWSYKYAAENQVIDIDIDLWEFERLYDDTTSPSVPNFLKTYPGAGHFTVGRYGQTLFVTNHKTEVLKHYATVVEFGYNVNFQTTLLNGMPAAAFIREVGSQSQLWILYTYGTQAEFGWIDLDEVIDPITQMYTWNSQFAGTTTWAQDNTPVQNMQYVAEADILMINTHSESYGGRGITLLTLSGALIKDYRGGELLPTYGAFYAVYYNNYIYFSFKYYAGQPDKRGLARINLNDDSVVYFVPTWRSVDDYELANLLHMEGTTRIVMTAGGIGEGGVAVFDTDDSNWTIYNQNTFPGLIQPGCSAEAYVWGQSIYSNNNPGNGIVYDPVTQTIYVCHSGCGYVAAFSEFGNFSILKYGDVTNPATTPVYGAVSDLSYDDYEDQAVIIHDSDDVLWVIWRHLKLGEYSIQWANAITNKDLSDYLAIETSIKIDWDIDRPAKLSFGLSHGHIFDPQNLLSTYSVYLKMGRQITIRFGETVSSVEYWQNQGVFIVVDQSLSYSTDKYPTMNVNAEDLRCLWEDNHVVASEYFNAETPKYILETVLPAHAGLEFDEMNIPVFDGSHAIYHQYIDMTVEEIVKSLLDHFMYYPFVNVEGEFEPRRLDITKAVDHAYSNLTQITKYTPDSTYATFINRVVVTGLSFNYQEVLYEEESIGQVSGTTGWWGKKEDDTVWYSDNHTKTCRYPRLEVIQSTSEFGMFSAFGGGKEAITYVDVDEQYCIITTTAPNMVPVLVALIGLAVATYTGCRGTCDGGPHKYGWCSFCNFAVIIEINALILILTGIASYNYNIWARPIGHEKQTHQAEANDYDFQAVLNGKTITEEIDDPYCYTIALCQTVADQEMAVVTAQRNRHKLTKTAHLQDELGDRITIPHPYSGETLSTMIVRLTREMKIGKEFLDHIEGWRLLS